MARGLFLNTARSHGHINPTIGLVKELVARGDEVVYVSSKEFKEKLEKAGAKYVACNEEKLNEITSIQETDIFKMLEVFARTNELIIETAMSESGSFDYLVYDEGIKVEKELLEKFNIKKVIALSTAFAMNEKIMGEIINDLKAINRVPSDEKTANEVLKFSQDYLSGKYTDLNIVFTSKYYQPYGDEFDDTYKFVGPSITNRQEISDFKIENPDNKKLVFVSLGTIVNKNLQFYKDCLEALGSRDDLIVIMSVGKKIDIKDLGEIPANFRVYNYVPQLEVLEQVDLFVTHGGMNSASEGLYNNLPLIVVPQMVDQFAVAKRVKGFGAGIELKGNITPNDINEAVNEILSNDSYRKNSEKIGKSLREAGGYKKAVDYIHNIIK